MENYWDSSSRPTIAGDRPLRLPAQPDSPWEYAYLLESLPAGGSAHCQIYRPASSGSLAATSWIVVVHDRLMQAGMILAVGALVRIQRYPAANGYDLVGSAIAFVI